MKIEEVIREIQRRTPLPPARRAQHGQWVKPAWVVRGLVEQGWGVFDAVHQTIATLNLHPPKKAFNGVKAAYYQLRNKPWGEEVES